MQFFRVNAESLSRLDNSIKFTLLDDEPLAAVLHLKRYTPNANLTISKPMSSSNTVANTSSGVELQAYYLAVRGGGSSKVQGLYRCFRPPDSASRSNSEALPLVYRRADGCTINRTQYQVLFPQKNASADSPSSAADTPASDTISKTNERNLSFYLWRISVPALNLLFYSCLTVDPTPMPPSTGWRAEGAGKLPQPNFSIVADVSELLKVKQELEPKCRASKQKETARSTKVSNYSVL
jgi:hypothetical protein